MGSDGGGEGNPSRPGFGCEPSSLPAMLGKKHLVTVMKGLKSFFLIVDFLFLFIKISTLTITNMEKIKITNRKTKIIQIGITVVNVLHFGINSSVFFLYVKKLHIIYVYIFLTKGGITVTPCFFFHSVLHIFLQNNFHS